jgi:hypothetical protein
MQREMKARATSTGGLKRLRAQLDAGIMKYSFAPQRSAGRKLGRWDSEPKTSSSRPSPPAFARKRGGCEHLASLNAFSILVHVFSRARRLAILGFILLFALSKTEAAPKANRAGAAQVTQIGTMTARGLIESSGVVLSSIAPNLFWTHNDGRSPILFAIDRQGSNLGQFTIDGVPVLDWEDIARDDSGNLYLADIGNNNAARDELAVHRFPEPKPGETSGRIKVNRSWYLKFPNEPFDCESLFIWKDSGYVVSKVFKNAHASIYRFDLSITNGAQTLQRVADLPVTSPVTAADISPDGQRLALTAKNGAYLFQIDGDVAKAGRVKPAFVKFREGQIEGCCFVPEGVLAVSEKREVFLFPESAFKSGAAAE